LGNGVIKMEQLLTANVATNLYWLGRYLERTEETLYEINKAYDAIIDIDKDAVVKLYKKFNIDLEYTNASDFLDKAIRGVHDANIVNIITQARENTIICRTHIDFEAFGEIIELHTLLQRISKSPLPIDYKDIDLILSLISEIWGAHTKRGHRKSSDYFFKLGKLAEEVDLRLRFDRNKSVTEAIIKDINIILNLLNPDAGLQLLSYDEEDDIMESINTVMKKLIIED